MNSLNLLVTKCQFIDFVNKHAEKNAINYWTIWAMELNLNGFSIRKFCSTNFRVGRKIIFWQQPFQSCTFKES